LAAKFTTQPWLFSTSAAWLYCRMHGGTIPVRTQLRGPRTSLCLLDDPVTFAINEDHAPKQSVLQRRAALRSARRRNRALYA
jgi:hypothetical protein